MAGVARLQREKVRSQSNWDLAKVSMSVKASLSEGKEQKAIMSTTSMW